MRSNEIRVALLAAPCVVDVAIPRPADVNCHVFAVLLVRLCYAHESGQDIDVSAPAYALGQEGQVLRAYAAVGLNGSALRWANLWDAKAVGGHGVTRRSAEVGVSVRRERPRATWHVAEPNGALAHVDDMLANGQGIGVVDHTRDGVERPVGLGLPLGHCESPCASTLFVTGFGGALVNLASDPATRPTMEGTTPTRSPGPTEISWRAASRLIDPSSLAHPRAEVAS